MDYLIIIVLILSLCSLFALIIYKLNEIEEEIKKQNECWRNLDKHFDKTVDFWKNIIDFVNKGDK